MKRTDVIRKLNAVAKAKGYAGVVQVREGANHTIFAIGSKMIPVGRHTEIPETTARKILAQAESAEDAPKGQEEQG